MKRIFPKRYLHRVFLLISAGLLIVVLSLSSVLLTHSEKVALDERQRNDKIMLSQIAHSIGFMHASILNVCNMMYNNPDVVSLMTDSSENPDIGLMTMKMYAINRTFVRTNPYIHSIYIYNPFSKTFYNSYSRGLLFRDTDLETYVAAQAVLPKLKPVYRSIKAPGIDVTADSDLLTYFQYDSFSDGRMSGGIVVNVRTGWLLDNLNTVSSTGDRAIGSVLLETNGGDFINGRLFDMDFILQLKAAQADHAAEPGARFYSAELAGNEYFVSEVSVENTGLRLLRVAERSQVDEYVNSLRMTIILITTGFLVLAVAVAILISSRIYRPVSQLINKISEQETRAAKDEFGFLGEVYERNTAAILQYESERHSYQHILKNAWLQGLLSGHNTDLPEDFMRMAGEYQLTISPDKGFFVAVLMMDGSLPYSTAKQEQLSFAVLNRVSRIVEAKYPNEGVVLPDGKIELIINAESGAQEVELIRLLSDAQARIMKDLEVSISVSISPYGPEPRDLPSLHEQAQHNTLYRFLYGKKSIIAASGVQKKPDTEDMDYAFPAENELVDALKLGKLPKVKDLLIQIFAEIRTMSYTSAMISLFHLTDTVRRTLGEIAQADMALLATVGAIGRNLLEQETIDDFSADLLTRLEQFLAFDPVHNVNRKHEMVVLTVTQLVLQNYGDVEMDLTRLAGMMKMSSKQLSRIFRERTGYSLPDYISSVRMQKAAELLEHTELSIGKIAAKTGIQNETYFFTMFKKHFGTSPSAFKTAKALDRARQNSDK